MFVLTLLLIYIVNLNAREILVTKMATKPEFLVTKEKMTVSRTGDQISHNFKPCKNKSVVTVLFYGSDRPLSTYIKKKVT